MNENEIKICQNCGKKFCENDYSLDDIDNKDEIELCPECYYENNDDFEMCEDCCQCDRPATHNINGRWLCDEHADEEIENDLN